MIVLLNSIIAVFLLFDAVFVNCKGLACSSKDESSVDALLHQRRIR